MGEDTHTAETHPCEDKAEIRVPPSQAKGHLDAATDAGGGQEGTPQSLRGSVALPTP